MGLQVGLPLNGNLKNNGTENVAITNNGATVSNSGKIGQCYNFGDGSASSKGIEISSNFTSLTDRTICAGVRPKGNHYHYSGAIASSGNWNNSRWAFCLKQDNTGFTGFDSAYSTYYSTSIPVNTGTHLCVTVTGTTTKFYKNGVYLGSQERGGTLASDATTTMIGRETYASGYFTFNGDICDVRIYDEVISDKEIKEISKGLVLHYPLSNPYIEATTNISSLTSMGGWANTGACTGNKNDTSYTNVPTKQPVYSGLITTAGNCAVTFGNSTINVPSKTLTCSVYCYLSGTQDSSVVYIRSTKTDGNIGSFSYNGSTNPTTWPQNTGIRLTQTITTNSEATTIYFCTYLNPLNCKRAFNGGQIEVKDHVTPYTDSSRTASLVYDTSGNGYDGTVVGTLNVLDNSARNNKCTFWPTASTYTNSIHSPTIYSSGEAITMNIGVKTTTTGGNSYQMPFESNSRCYCEMSITSSGQLRGGLYVNGTRYVTNVGSGLLNGNWHMITITYDGTTIRRYIDAVAYDTTSVTGTLSATEQSYWLGVLGTDTAYYNSNIYESDARLYATALSADDIKSLYNNSIEITNNGSLMTQGEIIEE